MSNAAPPQAMPPQDLWTKTNLLAANQENTKLLTPAYQLILFISA
jgi:hypothetical protein